MQRKRGKSDEKILCLNSQKLPEYIEAINIVMNDINSDKPFPKHLEHINKSIITKLVKDNLDESNPHSNIIEEYFHILDENKMMKLKDVIGELVICRHNNIPVPSIDPNINMHVIEILDNINLTKLGLDKDSSDKKRLLLNIFNVYKEIETIMKYIDNNSDIIEAYEYVAKKENIPNHLKHVDEDILREILSSGSALENAKFNDLFQSKSAKTNKFMLYVSVIYE